MKLKSSVTCLLVLFSSFAMAQDHADTLHIKHTLDSLLDRCLDIANQGQFEAAIAELHHAEALALQFLGERSFQYAICSYYCAEVHYLHEDYQKAEDHFAHTLLRLQKLPVPQPHLQATILEKLGNFCLERREWAKADSFYHAALSHLVPLRNEDPDTYATLLNEIAVSQIYMGRYSKAEGLLKEAVDFYRSIADTTSIAYSRALNNLALLYEEIGYFEQSKSLHQASLDLVADLVGKEHPEYARSLMNLAVLHHKMGDYRQAESLFLEALSLMEYLHGDDLSEYANCLNNLSNLYWDMGNLDKAEAGHQRIRAVRAQTLGDDHPSYAKTLDNLAGLALKKGQLNEAERLAHQAYTIFLGAYDTLHPAISASLQNLGNLQMALGNLDQAERYYQRAQALEEALFGREHYRYADVLTNLGHLYFNRKAYVQADTKYTEVLHIRQAALGTAHPDYVEALGTLAQTKWLLGDTLAAEKLYAAFAPLHRELLSRSIWHLTEKELNQYLPLFEEKLDELHALTSLRNTHAHTKMSYDNALFHKGFILGAVNQIQHLTHNQPEATALLGQLKSVRRRLAGIYATPIAYQDDPAPLEAEADALEKQLVLLVSEAEHALRDVRWEDVRAHLKPHEAALEFIHFNQNTLVEGEDAVQYGALLLWAESEQPVFIPLFDERALEHLHSPETERKSDYVNNLYAHADRSMVSLGSRKKTLYELIWAHVEPHLPADITTLYYSSSGILHRLNPGAIALDDETILSDRYRLVALNSTRQLVTPVQQTVIGREAVLVGGVDFDAQEPLFDDSPLLASRSENENWAYLKWTNQEVQRIASTLAASGFNTGQYTGAEASEEALKSIGTQGPSPRILHIATHGFFFPDPKVGQVGPETGAAGTVFKSSHNPMIRSGLILAGGNYAWQHGQAPNPEQEDGILTAYEISQMNLSNTELVILSACETGLGDIQGNEGVFGLQRAFKIAGARYLMMSLWQVPDRETMEFMTTFYRNWLEVEDPATGEKGMTIPDAFRKTQREMRDRFFNPYAWGAFVLVE
jgi:CHAT domain-containing protein/Tfp pilus assembly protein PilF